VWLISATSASLTHRWLLLIEDRLGVVVRRPGAGLDAGDRGADGPVVSGGDGEPGSLPGRGGDNIVP